MVFYLTGNLDYRIFPARRTVTFSAGSTRAQYSGYLVIDDALVERDETFDLIIDNSTLPNGVSLGDPCQARITIQDDDSEWSCSKAILATMYMLITGEIQLNFVYV